MPRREFNLTDLNGINGFTINGIAAGDRSGTSVSSAGDVNGDGFLDVLIGAYNAEPNGQALAGEAYLVFSHQGQWPTQFSLSSLNGSNGVILAGIGPEDGTGISVASAGDVNDDGLTDILIGAYGANPNGQTGAGESYVVFGRTGSWPASMALSSLNGSNGLELQGIDAYDYSGWRVSAVGDLNADGVDDVIIAAPGADPNGQTDAGESYVVFGHEGSWSASVVLSSLNGSNGFVFQGIDAYDDSGCSVSAAGDLNGDGIDDVIIGAFHASPNGQSDAGESYVVFGHTGSWPASMTLSSLNGANGLVLQGIDANDNSGVSVASAGDLNGDGIDDVIIGAQQPDPGQSNSGESYVVFGHRGSWPASMPLSSLNGSNGLVLLGINAFDYSGVSVSTAGDLNGDGFSDVIIGAYGADPNNRTNTGQSYVIFGGAEQLSANQIEIVRGETLTLNASNIEIEPNINSRIINVTDVEHGHFALASNQSAAIDSFNQSQINNNEIVFVHDGSDQAPSYTVSAEGITRVFSNVHPQQANVSFILSTSTTSTQTSATSSTITDTTRTETTTTDTATTVAPTVVPTVNPTSFFGASTSAPTPQLNIATSSPTAQINGGDETVTNDNGGSSDSSGLIIGVAAGVIGLLAFILALGYIYYRRNEHEKQKAILAREAEGARGEWTVAMTNNPLFVAGANRMNVSDGDAGVGTGARALGDGYLDVDGEAQGDVSEYETPVPVKTAGIVLDADHYVFDPVQSTSSDAAPAFHVAGADGAIYAVPMTAGGHGIADNSYSLFSSKGLVGNRGGLNITGQQSDAINTDNQYRVFRSPGSSQG